MNKGLSKVAVRALIVGGVAVVALVTAARRCDQPTREPVQENVAASSAPAPLPVPAAKPRPPALVPPTPAAAPAPSSAPAAALGEAQLMARLRTIKDSNAAAAIELARDGNRRFPDSADAPERHSILIHALANAEQRSEARGEAEQMVNHYPDSEWVREIERFTGAHRHRNIRVNDAGELVSY
jgi:type IV secretory pathway VirB10-like protein